MKGRKHRDNIARADGRGGSTSGGGGVCFQFQKNGMCTKGKYCTYRHVRPSDVTNNNNNTTTGNSYYPSTSEMCHEIKMPPSASSSGTKRSFEVNTEPEIVAKFELLKQSANVTESPPKAAAKGGDAFNLMMSASKSKSKAKKNDEINKYNFPEIYKNALKRKQNVNLYIKDNAVVWQFSYNATVIAAVKTIKGRKYDPQLKSWLCPLESLPECVSLYKYMGREPDRELKDRADEISKSYAGTSASDAIKIAIRLSVDETSLGIGAAVIAFYYDASVVEALKMIPPSCRNYNSVSKEWSVDLLALPHVMEFLLPLSYHPSQELKLVCESISSIDSVLNEPKETKSPGADSIEKVQKENQLNKEIQKLISLLQRNKEEKADLDRSDYGKAKHRRLTSSQMAYSGKGDFQYLFSALFDRISSNNNTKQRRTPIDCDCGNPQKLINGQHTCRYFGKFECSACGNNWTSAYCWKGETQACRGCNKENLPVKTENLKKEKHRMCNNTSGAHDSARCAMCQKLGRRCNI